MTSPAPNGGSRPQPASRSLIDVSLTQWRRELLNTVLRFGSLFGLVVLLIAGVVSWQQNDWLLVGIYLGAYLLWLVSALFKFLPYPLRAGVLLLILYALSVAGLYANGLGSVGSLFLFAFALLALLLLGSGAGAVALGLSALTLGGAGWLFISGVRTLPAGAQTGSADILAWSLWSVAFVVLALPILYAVSLLLRHINQVLAAEQRLRAELQAERENLGKQIAENSQRLERHTAQVKAAADIAHIASTELDADKLLSQVVNILRTRFELYYVGIFLNSEDQHFAALKAGTGEAGRLMLARNHQIEIDDRSLVGRAISERKACVFQDAGESAEYFSNPYLPLTQAELALPLTARERVVGALTIQSDQPTAFPPEVVVSLQGMADLIAVAIDNDRLFQEAQQALEEVTTLHKSYVAEAWSNFARLHSREANTPPTYVYAGRSLVRDDTATLPALEQALTEEKLVVTAGDNVSALTIPIRLRDQVIGVLAIEADTPDRVWLPNELAFVESVIEQTALSLENARLIEETETALAETRRLATREQTVNIISTKLRRLPSVENVLTTALLELGHALGASKGLVRLGAAAKHEPLTEAAHE